MREPPDWILVGMVKRIHGQQGEMLIMPLTERVEERFDPGSILYLSLKRDDVRARVKVASSRMSDKGPLIKLEGFESRDEVWELFGASLFIRASEMSEPGPDRYYPYQLEGCEVFQGERLIGRVSALHESIKANPYLEVDPGTGKHVYVPFITQVIKSIDLDRQRIDIVEGFLGEE